MSEPTLRFTPKAKIDLIAIWADLSQYSDAAADRILRHIDEADKLPARNPRLGVARPDYGNDMRKWVVEDHVIIYRPVHGGVEVVRIAHGKRDLTKI